VTDIVAVSRLEKSRKKKRGRSDRMDAKALTYMDWTDKRFPRVWVPSREQEGMRNLLMLELTLDGSLRRCRNRGVSVLARWGISYKLRMSERAYKALLDGLPERSVGDMDRLRLESLLREEDFLNSELLKLGPVRDAYLKSDPSVEKLQVWRGIGEKTAKALAWYVGDWKRFPNGNSFSAYCGLTSVHSRSASSDRDKGVSKAGHWVLRKTFGQLALLWQRWQPDCPLVKNMSEKVTGGKMARIARTALARQLAVALWKWMVYDELIEGALQNPPDK
jgi:transposase